MRRALLVLCIASVVFALLLQTFLFHQSLRRQIRAESISDHEISLNKMQTDLSNFIHTIHLDLTTRVNLVQNLLKTKELPVGFKKKLNEFAALLSITRSNFHLVTVKKQKYYVYRYEGKLNGIENAVVLLSYPEKAFGNPKALQAFLSTDVSLSVDETLSYYAGRWPIEIFFRQCKNKLALDSYQIRSAQGIRRYWLLMSMAPCMCVAGTGEFCSFEKGYHRIGSIIQTEKYQYLFRCAKESNDFDAFMKLAG